MNLGYLGTLLELSDLLINRRQRMITTQIHIETVRLLSSRTPL